MVSVNVAPVRPSRMSLRTRSVNDGNGPAVSVGVTAQAEFVDPAEVPPASLGLVGLSEHPSAIAAPAAPSVAIACRRGILLLLMSGSSFVNVDQAKQGPCRGRAADLRDSCLFS